MNTRLWGALSTGIVASAAALLACGSSSKTGEAKTTSGNVDPEQVKALQRLDESGKLVTAFDEKIPDSVAQRTHCVVAVPSMAKGGLIIGGAGGGGFATCKTPNGWSAPAPVSVGGGTFGAQIGYQETDVLSLVTSAKGMQGLATGNFKVGADASATAGPVGTGRGTGTELDSNADMLSYSRSKGLFAGAELNGTTIKLDKDAAKALYGPGHDMRGILGGSVQPPSEPAGQSFMQAVRSAFGDGKS